MKNKLKIPFLFFILVYANQGLSDLPSQCIYYLTRETWKLSATMLGIIGFMIGLAWYIKPLFGILTDYFSIKKYRTKYYLYINYIFIILACLFVVFFGLNFITLLITLTLINFAIAFNDVANDCQMVQLEKKYKLQGRIQSLQWSALGIGGLIVALGGAWIANTFPEPLNYKIAYACVSILPILTLIYLFKKYKEVPVKRVKKFKFHHLKNQFKKAFSNKSFILCLLFIMCLNFCPSFGTALRIKLREELFVDKMFLGWLGATGTVLSLIGYMLYYWKAYKFSMKKLLYFMIIFSGLTNLCYLYIPNKWTILVYSIMFGAFNGIAFLALLSFFARIVPTGGEGLFYALVTSVSNLSTRIGGVFGGVIYDHFGYNLNVIISACLTLACIFFIPRLMVDRLT